MSSTNRGGKRSPADFYATQPWVVRRLLQQLYLPSGRWLEPCAGDGAIIRAVNDWSKSGFLAPLTRWTACELREECVGDLQSIDPSLTGLVIGDFFQRLEMIGSGYDVCITNPPFSLAMEFIQACRSISDHAIFLLRLGFLGSEERSSFIRDTRPDIYILPNRPEFAMSVQCGEKKERRCEWRETLPLTDERPRKCGGCLGKVQISTTDSIEYAWFHWYQNSVGKYVILPDTPIEERRAGRKKE